MYEVEDAELPIPPNVGDIEEGAAGWRTSKSTQTPEDTDMPDDTPTWATAAPTPDDTVGCYFNTQRAAGNQS